MRQIGMATGARRNLAIAMAAVATFMACCAGPEDDGKGKPQGSTYDAGLISTSWIVQSIDGVPAIQSPRSMLVFESATMIVGTSGCNNFSGTVGLAGAEIIVGPLASTQRACESALMAQEARFFSSLQTTRSFQVNEQVLLLYGPTGAQSLELTRAPEPL
jgi:heat shock protein HslJ